MPRKVINITPSAVEKAQRDPARIPRLISALGANGAGRFAVAKELGLIAKEAPNLVYPYWNTFAALLESTSSVLLWNGLIILSSLVEVDSERRFDSVVERYLSHLRDRKLVNAANVIVGCGRILTARPDLYDRIITELVNVDRIPLPTDECHEVIRGHVLAVIGDCRDLVNGDERVAYFVRRCSQSSRPSTRKKAEELIQRLGI
jgi:hypothetical protein